MDAQLAKLLEPQITKHWGQVCEFTPSLLEKVYGDGKQLVQLFPLMERPRYWVVRVDSSCNGSGDDWFDILDDVYEAIDEQFGCPPEEDDGIGDERPYFPMYDNQGTTWNFL